MEILKYRSKLETSSTTALIGCLGGGAFGGNEGAVIVGVLMALVAFIFVKPNR